MTPLAAVIGIGSTQFTKRGGMSRWSERALACQAILAAVEDAGIAIGDIDGVISHGYDRTEPALLQEALGLPHLRYWDMIWGNGGNGAFATFNHAVAAIMSGRARTVAIYRSVKQLEDSRFGDYRLPHATNFHRPFGLFSPATAVALLARRYLEANDVTPAQLAHVALTFREHANRNPRAIFHNRPLTLDQYLNAPKIAEPLCLFDCCLETDGACAIILTAPTAVPGGATNRVVDVVAAAEGFPPQWGTGTGAHGMPDTTYQTGPSTECARQLYVQAACGPNDIASAQFYDHFSPMVLLYLEAFGICAPGQAAAFVADGGLHWSEGKLPANTSGGHLSEAYIHGLNLAIEAVHQIRGTSTAQAARDGLALVATGGSGVLLKGRGG